jgi:hypothetical protein
LFGEIGEIGEIVEVGEIGEIVENVIARNEAIRILNTLFSMFNS